MLGALLSTVLTLSLSVLREIFPYLVVVIGLENVLVLTKSVVSTPVDLEVKLRIAQGNTAGCGGAPGRAGGRAVCAGRGRWGAPDVTLALPSSVIWCGPPGLGSLLACALRNQRVAGLYRVLVHMSVRTQTGLCCGTRVFSGPLSRLVPGACSPCHTPPH